MFNNIFEIIEYIRLQPDDNHFEFYFEGFNFIINKRPDGPWELIASNSNVEINLHNCLGPETSFLSACDMLGFSEGD
jgi:hypothetical protein